MDTGTDTTVITDIMGTTVIMAIMVTMATDTTAITMVKLFRKVKTAQALLRIIIKPI